MKKKRDKKGFLFGFVGALVKFIFPYKIVFKSPVPESGALLACANHISYIDPFFVREAIGRKVFFMAKKEVFRFKILDFFARRNGVIPVDRGGRDMEAVKRSLTVLKNGDVIGIFPSGTRAFKNPDAKYHDGAAVFAVFRKLFKLRFKVRGGAYPRYELRRQKLHRFISRNELVRRVTEDQDSVARIELVYRV